jgi:hypothetical protein
MKIHITIKLGNENNTIKRVIITIITLIIQMIIKLRNINKNQMRINKIIIKITITIQNIIKIKNNQIQYKVM